MSTQPPADTGQSDRAFIDEALSALDSEPESKPTADEVTLDEPEVTPPAEEVEEELEPGQIEIDTEKAEGEPETPPEEVKASEDEAGEAPLPEYKDIKAKYPKFFEEFPALKEAFFLGKQLTSLFPSYELAQEAKDQLRSFDAIRISSLEEGDPTHLFAALSEASPAGFERMAENILPNLFNHAPQLYLKVTTPLLENLVRSVYKEGMDNDNKNLKAAAQIISKYLWGTLDIPQAKPKVENPEVRRLTAERQRDLVQRETEFKGEVWEIGVTALTKHILNGLDPNNAMPEITKDALVSKIIKETGAALDKDGLHNNRMNALWELAARNGFSREYKKKLVETYLRAAGAKMTGIRARLRGEVLGKSNGGQTPVVRKEVVRRPPPGRTNAASPGGSGKLNVANLDPKKIDWSKTSDRDLLAGKVTLKR